MTTTIRNLLLLAAAAALGACGQGNDGAGTGAGAGTDVAAVDTGAAASAAKSVDGAAFEEGMLAPLATMRSGTAVKGVTAGVAEGDDAGITVKATAPTQIGTSIDAYASRNSVAPGQAISFHLSDHAGSAAVRRSATVTIDRVAPVDQRVYTGVAAMSKQQVPDDAWVNCCDWPAGLTLTIPANWKSGLYRARFESPDGPSTRVYFVVRAANPGAAARIVVEVPFDTAQAYNEWGGKSLYGYNSVGGVAAQRVSTLRPTGNTQYADFARWAEPLIRWAESRSIALEFVAGTDLHTTPGVLSKYKAVVLVGHDEYWTGAMRGELERFVAAGGNVASFSANTMWWRTELLADARGRANGLLEGRKETGTLTSNWYEHSLEGRLLGSSWARGGYIDDRAKPGPTQIGYAVHEPAHWVFRGTGLAANATLGRTERLLRYEVDGVDFRYTRDGRARPTGGDGVPSDTTILALTPLSGWDTFSSSQPMNPNLFLTGEAGGWAMITLRKAGPRGGMVFTGGTTDWARGLEACVGAGATQTAVCTVTRNVLLGFSGGFTTNIAPSLTNPGTQDTNVGIATRVVVPGTDPNGDTLTFVASGLPPGLAIDAATGVVSGTPTTRGNYRSTVTVGDGRGGTAQVQFAWSVGSALAPVAKMLSPTPGATMTGGTATFRWTAAGDLYCLSVDSPGLPTLFSRCGTETSVEVTGLPKGGQALVVNLQTRQNLNWRPAVEYRYVAATAPVARLATPAPGSVLASDTVEFRWDAAGDLYCLSIQQPGQPALFSQCTTATSVIATGLPTGGQALVVNLQTRQNLVWKPAVEARYTAMTR